MDTDVVVDEITEASEEQISRYSVKPVGLQRDGQMVGYTVFVVDDKGHLVEWAIREDERYNRSDHAHVERPQTPEAAMARYEQGQQLDTQATVARPYAPLIRSVTLPAD